MRNGEPAMDDEEGSNYDFGCDWKEGPDDVMESVNTQLKKYGLEVISHETDGDYFAFSIRKIKKDAVKKSKVHPLTTRSLAALGVALKTFGEYTFGDKGAAEVMDIKGIAAEYRALPAKEAAIVLLELNSSKEHRGHGTQLAEEIVCRLSDWDELIDCPEIEHMNW